MNESLMIEEEAALCRTKQELFRLIIERMNRIPRLFIEFQPADCDYILRLFVKLCVDIYNRNNEEQMSYEEVYTVGRMNFGQRVN